MLIQSFEEFYMYLHAFYKVFPELVSKSLYLAGEVSAQIECTALLP